VPGLPCACAVLFTPYHANKYPCSRPWDISKAPQEISVCSHLEPVTEQKKKNLGTEEEDTQLRKGGKRIMSYIVISNKYELYYNSFLSLKALVLDPWS
jgi:hypothetical protein